MAYYINDNGLGKDGEIWNAWGKDVFTSLLNWVTNMFGTDAANQVQQNPDSAYAQQMMQMFQLAMANQQKQDDTLKYVGIGLAAALVLYMVMDNNGKKR